MSAELPAWVTALVDQRLALIEDKMPKLPTPVATLVMTPLTEPGENATAADLQRWERTCDNCGTFCPDGTAFYTGHLVRELRNGTPVYLTLGVCAGCIWQ